MELTSFNLKLSEILKEYEQAKQERQEANKAANTTDIQLVPTQPTTFKWQKSEKEIRERIGLNLSES
jgi:predicted  nucleic acid-binding Zn-ribbon protein